MAKKVDMAKLVPAVAKKLAGTVAKSASAGVQIGEGTGGMVVRLSEVIEGVRAEIAFTTKDDSGRTWTTGLSGVGKDKAAAIQDLQAEFARRPIRISSIVEKALEGIKKEKGKLATPISPLVLAALPESKLREMAEKRGLKVEGGKDELVAALEAERAAAMNAPDAEPAPETI
jgi:hypothetical protein